MSKKISRRDFFKIAGAAAVTVVGAEVVTPLIYPEKLEFDENVSLWAPAQPPKYPALAQVFLHTTGSIRYLKSPYLCSPSRIAKSGS